MDKPVLPTVTHRVSVVRMAKYTYQSNLSPR